MAKSSSGSEGLPICVTQMAVKGLNVITEHLKPTNSQPNWLKSDKMVSHIVKQVVLRRPSWIFFIAKEVKTFQTTLIMPNSC